MQFNERFPISPPFYYLCCHFQHYMQVIILGTNIFFIPQLSYRIEEH